MRVDGRDDVLREGDSISIDGFTGEVFARRDPDQAAARSSQVLIDKTLKPDAVARRISSTRSS